MGDHPKKRVFWGEAMGAFPVGRKRREFEGENPI